MYDWFSVPSKLIGDVNMLTTDVKSFQVPSTSVPAKAKQVLIFIYFRMGYAEKRSGIARVFTKVFQHPYIYPVLVHPKLPPKSSYRDI